MALDEKDIETVKGLIGEANKPLTTLLDTQKKASDELIKNVGILADTIKNAPPAKAEDKGDKKPEALTADAVTKLVADGIAADRKQQQQDAEKSDAIKAAKDKVVKDKLGGDADYVGLLPDTADEAQLNAVADTLAKKATPKAKLPGTAGDGGTPPARQPLDYSKMSASQKVSAGIDQLLAGAK